MTKRYDYIGGFISTTSVPQSRGGIYSLSRQLQLERTNSWNTDSNFANVSLLLNADSNTTSFIRDNSSNNFLLTNFGDVRPNAVNPYDGTYYSAYFNGSSDFLTLPGNSVFNITTGTTPFTIEAWIKPMGNTGCVFSESFTGGSNPINIVISMADGVSMDTGTVGQTICFGWYTGGAWVTAAGANQALTLGQWTHLACVFTGTTTRIYYNGIDVTKPINPTPAATWGITNNNGDGYFIGRRWDTTGSPFFNGFIKDFRFVRGTAVYTSNFTPPAAPLSTITNTSVLTCQNNRFIDNSGNNLTITANGSVQVSHHIPFTNFVSAVPGSVYFDGAGDYLSFPASAGMAMGTGDYTIECWIYPIGSGDFTIIDNQGSGGLMQISRISGVLYHGSATIWSYTFTNNSWTHIAFSRSGTNLRLFANGVLQQTQTNSNSIGSAANTNTIGIRNDNFYPLNGYINNLRVVRGTAIYTANFTPPAEPLTAVTNTVLLTCQNTGSVNNSQFMDRSNYNLIVTRNGNSTQGSFNPYANNWCVYFNGSSNLAVNNTGSVFGTNNFTIEFWVYPVTAPGTSWSPFFSMGSSGGGQEIRISQNINGTGFGALFPNNASNADTFAGFGTMPLHTWHHVALVRNGSSIILFRNGAVVNTWTGVSFNYTNTGTILVGFGKYGSDGYTTCYVSNLRILNGTALYTAAFTPPTSALTAIANTSLLICQSNRYIDLSTNNLAVTNSGGAEIQRFHPFLNTTSNYNSTIHSGSIYFDGASDWLSVASTPATAFGSNNFTIEFWVYFTNATGTANHQGLYSNYTTWTTNSFYFGKHPSNSGFVAVHINNFGGLLLAETSFPPNNAWTHYALVRNGTSVILYRNGTASASATVSATLSFTGASNPVFIGAIGDILSTSSLPGYICDFRISNYAVYLSSFTPPTTPVQPDSGTLLMIGNQAAIPDQSMGFDFETNGDARTSALIRRHGSASLAFDGNNDWLFTPGNRLLNFGSGNWTVEAWVYLNAMPTSDAWPTNFSSHFVLTCVGTANAGDGWNTIIGQTRLMIHSNDTQFAGTVHGMVINTWYHIAYVRNGNTIFFYVNGNPVGSAAFSGSLGVGTHTWIGCETGQGAFFNGFVDDLRVTRGVARYTAAFTPPTRLAIQ